MPRLASFLVQRRVATGFGESRLPSLWPSPAPKTGNGINEMEVDTSLKSLAGNSVPMISNRRLVIHGGILMLIIWIGGSSVVTILN